MRNSVNRSVRIDLDLPTDTLPPRTLNRLINSLLRMYFSDPTVLKTANSYDTRLLHYTPPEVEASRPEIPRQTRAEVVAPPPKQDDDSLDSLRL